MYTCQVKLPPEFACHKLIGWPSLQLNGTASGSLFPGFGIVTFKATFPLGVLMHLDTDPMVMIVIVSSRDMFTPGREIGREKKSKIMQPLIDLGKLMMDSFVLHRFHSLISLWIHHQQTRISYSPAKVEHLND